MKGSDNFKQTIREYLETRGAKDPLFAQIITKPGKNMDDCITHILETVQKSGCNGFTDDEVYSIAIHYFDEDNLKVGSFPSNMKVVVNHKVELTAEDKAEAKEIAMKQLVEKEKEKVLAKQKKEEDKKKEKIEKKAEEIKASEKTLF